MAETRQPFYHGRFREDKMGDNRWAIEFYSFTGAMKVLIIDHLPSRDEAVRIRNDLNNNSGISDFIQRRKDERDSSQH